MNELADLKKEFGDQNFDFDKSFAKWHQISMLNPDLVPDPDPKKKFAEQIRISWVSFFILFDFLILNYQMISWSWSK